MKLVVDANILFSLAKKDSAASEITEGHGLSLYAPSYAIAELKKYRSELVRKSSSRNFGQVKRRLEKTVEFIHPKAFRNEIVALKGAITDPKDTIYIALAKMAGAIIWSNDPHLKEQTQVIVLNTAELIEILGWQQV